MLFESFSESISSIEQEKRTKRFFMYIFLFSSVCGQICYNNNLAGNCFRAKLQSY